jgi:sensor histidine kinase YesM
LLNLEWGFVDWIVYWTILGAFYAFEYYRRFQERELRNSQLQSQLNEAELRALKMQIHPHFLFNTLNALSTIVKQGKKKQADSIISQLGSFLRMTLDEGGTDEIPLEKELEFVRMYLEIEKIRFQDKLEIQLEIHPSTYNAFVPALILQPIVENAVRYAIAPKESIGTITLRAWRKNGTLIIEIEDDGPGSSSLTSAKSSIGIGLKNVQQRLETLYGEAQEFALHKFKKGGCVVRIELPFKSTADSSIPVSSAN